MSRSSGVPGTRAPRGGRGWRAAARRVASGIVAGAALFGSTTGMQAWAAARPETSPATTSTSVCQDVLFIGVRGSGETPADGLHGMGQESTLVWQEYAAHTGHLRTAAVAIDYPSTKVTALASPYSASQFFVSIDTGVDKMMSSLLSRAAQCPTERYVLSGKSQGAIVAHRSVEQLSRTARTSSDDSKAHASADVLERIDGVVAVADPDRVPLEAGQSYGSSADGPRSHGISYAAPAVAGSYYRPSSSPIDQSWNHPQRWHSVCNSGDAVCDFQTAASSPQAMFAGFDVHTYSYLSDAEPLREAGRAVAAQSIAQAPRGQAVPTPVT